MELADKRNRGDLKKYFVKNAIPTESHFAELIDGTLNQKDDGIAKVPGDPLSLEASGDASSQKKTLSLYADFEDELATWVLSLNPRSDPAKPETAKSGFSIGEPDGTSRLFIDKKTGHLGVGTLEAPYRLNVAGWVRMCMGTNPLNFTSKWQGTTDHGNNVAEIANDTGTYKTLMIVGNRSGGGARRVSIWDRLEIHGHLHVHTGALSFSSSARQMVNFWGTEYGIGIQHSTQYFRTHQNFAWFKSGKHDNGELNAGGGSVQMVIRDGNVGIGRSDPSARLHVNGESIMTGALTFGPKQHFQMINLFDGSHAIGSQHYTTYFRTPRNFAWYKDGSHHGDEINAGGGAVQMVIRDGNVGIGKPDPGARLDVNGDAVVANTIQCARLEASGDSQVTGTLTTNRVEAGNAHVQAGVLSFSTSVRQMINLWNASYGIGIQGHTMYFRTGHNFAWYRGGSHHDSELNPGGGTVQMAINEGNVGIGTANPGARLHVNGDTHVAGGALSFSTSVRQMINLWNADYGIGMQGSTQYFRTGKNFAWYKGGSHANGELNPGGGAVQMVIRDGNVGIGTGNPSARLQVSGGTTVLQQEPWRPPALQSGWGHYGGGFTSPAFFKDSVGVVHLKGLVRGGAIGQPIFTLPVGYRPAERELFGVATEARTTPVHMPGIPPFGHSTTIQIPLGTAGRVDVLPDGRVIPVDGNSNWISMDGISFRAG